MGGWVQNPPQEVSISMSICSVITTCRTELNRDGEGYKNRAARAKLLANQIEGGRSSKHGFDDVGTEEEL